jgi:hypothetical protein
MSRTMFDRSFHRFSETLGYLLCELAFKTDCRGPFAWAYRLGFWFHGQATDAGVRCGELVENSAFGRGSHEPLYIRRSR